MWISRSQYGRASRSRTTARSGCTPSSPEKPCSRLWNAFWSDSVNVRPMAITSPTAFICVVSSSSTPSNLSKFQRGILVTT